MEYRFEQGNFADARIAVSYTHLRPMKDVSATPYAQRLLELHLPRYGEIPRIDLYMDQLVGFLEETLAPLYQPDEKIITRCV